MYLPSAASDLPVTPRKLCRTLAPARTGIKIMSTAGLGSLSLLCLSVRLSVRLLSVCLFLSRFVPVCALGACVRVFGTALFPRLYCYHFCSGAFLWAASHLSLSSLPVPRPACSVRRLRLRGVGVSVRSRGVLARINRRGDGERVAGARFPNDAEGPSHSPERDRRRGGSGGSKKKTAGGKKNRQGSCRSSRETASAGCYRRCFATGFPVSAAAAADTA